MHLVDHARQHIEQTYKRPVMNRFTRAVLAAILPYPARFKTALKLARIGRPFAPVFDKFRALKPFAAMLKLAPSRTSSPSKFTRPGVLKAGGNVKSGRVALLTGCAQPVLDSEINKATISLLNRLGVEVVLPEGEACCGSLVHHMGREEQALNSARHMVDVWNHEIENGGLDAIIITTSGCGTTIKDYGHMLKEDETYREKAKAVSALAMDISEYLQTCNLPAPVNEPNLAVTYHAACSLQHGQQIKTAPKDLLKAAGFAVKEAPEAHLCCGSAGTYNILQSEIADKLKVRKVTNIESTKPDVIAAGNIGCLTQIASGTGIPVVHTVKLLNWAYGGERPSELN